MEFTLLMSLNETGSVTLCTGMVVLFLGSLFLVDPALVIAGNILAIAGFGMFLKTNALTLLKWDKIQGTTVFILGISAMLFRYTLFGLLLETSGLLMIFKSTLPSFRALFYSVLLGRFYKKK